MVKLFTNQKKQLKITHKNRTRKVKQQIVQWKSPFLKWMGPNKWTLHTIFVCWGNCLLITKILAIKILLKSIDFYFMLLLFATTTVRCVLLFQIFKLILFFKIAFLYRNFFCRIFFKRVTIESLYIMYHFCYANVLKTRFWKTNGGVFLSFVC